MGGGGSGQATLDLRALGSNRVLVLLDGRRIAPERADGEVNVALMPNVLIERVDIVTGGASAAYGSDAVAGVVNFVLNKKFNGVRANAYAGISNYGDRTSFGAEVGVGLPFAGGRGHFLTSVEYADQNGLRWYERPGPKAGYQLINNPDPTGPTMIRAKDVRWSSGSGYGLVTAGPLTGLTWDADGTPRQFDFGTNNLGGKHIGGDGEVSVVGPEGIMVGWQNRGTMFNRLSFDISDDITLFAESLLGWTKNQSGIGWGYSIGATAFTIYQDNAYLDPAIRDTMIANGVNSIRVNRFNADFPNNEIETKSFKWRPVVGANFSLGDWKGEVSFSPTYSRRQLAYVYGMDQIRSIQAADAVVAPVGAPNGIIPGTVVCRATLEGTLWQGTPCTPINVMGAAAPEAIAALHPQYAEWNKDVFKQQSFSASIDGPLFNLPAGTVRAAVGVDYRHESVVFTSDPYSQVLNPITNALGGWRAGSAQPFSGTQSVKEAFAELAVPLLRDSPIGASLELNGAVRVTDYRTSGTVTTWKVGLMYRPIEELLIRGTRSRDIRAPSLFELYNGGTAGTAVVVDPFLGNISYGGVKTASTGNPLLTPEFGDTYVIGATYRPNWLPGLNMAVDYWRIELDDAIASISNQSIIDDCYRDNVNCEFISRDNTGYINAINNRPINFANRLVHGIDYEVSYRTPLSFVRDGLFSTRVVATQLFNDRSESRGVIDEAAGEVGDSKLKILWQTTLKTGPVSSMLTGRYLSGAVYDNKWKSGVDIDDNNIESCITFDAKVGYSIESMKDTEIYVSVANLFNKAPPIVYHRAGTVPLGTNTSVYDIIGRYFRVGAKVSF
jgi:outer membrane receptor protein involved in Fe transport